MGGFVGWAGELASAQLMFAEGISNGDSDAKNVVGMKFAIVEDVVPMSFGTHEEISPRRVLHAHAKVKKEMVAVEGGVQPPVGMSQPLTWL